MTEPLLRLDRNLDGSGDLYAVFPGSGEELIGHLDPGQVREFRAISADSRIPGPEDN